MKLERTTEFKLPMGILGAGLSADGKTLAAGCMDGVYRVDLAKKSYDFVGTHGNYVSSAAFLNDDTTILSAGYDGGLQWFHVEDADKSQPVRSVAAHKFWSWDMAISPNGKLAASVTGQYLAGGYKYEPAAETEPSVRILSTATGEILHSLTHTPSVQAVAFSHDSRFVAAGNLMGEVRVWNVETGKLVSTIRTDAFTSWGIIKSHCYLGGIFALKFTPDDSALLLAGMGPMRDPMAGNGKQLWQKWSWSETETEPKLIDQTHKGENGEGLMETLALHPTGDSFVMAGRLRGGDWNAAVFDTQSGNRIAKLKTGYRITEAHFTRDGQQLVLVGTQGQPRKHGGKFGRVEVYAVK